MDKLLLFLISFFWRSSTRTIALQLMKLLQIKKGRVFVSCWGGNGYSCNPRAITDTLIEVDKEECFEIIYAFSDPEKFITPNRIKKVEVGTVEYYVLLATSQFIMSNVRFAGDRFPYKKNNQIYIQTMHGPHGVKKVEFDACDSLNKSYLDLAEEDSKRADLFLSNSKMTTNLYRTAYHYYGEVLEHGLPRNKVFFEAEDKKREIGSKVIDFLSGQKELEENFKLLLYTPTFRSNGRKDVYGFDVDNIVHALEHRFGGVWYILVSSHPNMLSYYHEIYNFSHPRLLDVGLYPNLHDLMIVSGVLLTDYSAASIDFIITKRPVFQLIRDMSDYDRGTYIAPKELPFPYSENDEELCLNVLNFDNEKYQRDLETFMNDTIGFIESENASMAVVDWMKKRID